MDLKSPSNINPSFNILNDNSNMNSPEPLHPIQSSLISRITMASSGSNKRKKYLDKRKSDEIDNIDNDLKHQKNEVYNIKNFEDTKAINKNDNFQLIENIEGIEPENQNIIKQHKLVNGNKRVKKERKREKKKFNKTEKSKNSENPFKAKKPKTTAKPNELIKQSKTINDKIPGNIFLESPQDLNNYESLFDNDENKNLTTLEIKMLKEGLNSSKKKEENILASNINLEKDEKNKQEIMTFKFKSKFEKSQMDLREIFQRINKKNEKAQTKIKKPKEFKELKEKLDNKIQKTKENKKVKKKKKSEEKNIDMSCPKRTGKNKSKKSKDEKQNVFKICNENKVDISEEPLKISKKHKLQQENNENQGCKNKNIKKKRLKIIKSDDYKKKKDEKYSKVKKRIIKSETHFTKKKGRPPKELK